MKFITPALCCAVCLCFDPSGLQAEILVHPGDDVQQMVNQNPAGTAFRLSGGLYRSFSIQPKDDDSFIGDAGAHLTGAQVLTGFSRSGSYYVISGQFQHGQVTDASECDPQHPACNYPEDLFFDNHPLQHVGQLAEVGPGKWYFDYANHSIYFADDPTGHTVETSVTRSAFYGPASHVTIQGLLIEKYANPAQMGAIGDQYPGPGWIILHNEVCRNHGLGIAGGIGSHVSGNHVHHNGELGIGATDQSVIENNEIDSNNWAGYDCNWECGGAKFVATHLVVTGNNVHDNLGPGLWTDIDSDDVTYADNIILNNQGPGISHEISHQAVISGNTIKGNGFINSGWAWGGQIQIQNSDHVEVSSNIVQVSTMAGQGIFIVEQCRADSASPCGHPVHDNFIHHNTMFFPAANGSNGLVQDIGIITPYALSANNLFDYNHYHVAVETGTYWSWADTALTWTGFQSHGQELHGSVDTHLTESPQPPIPPTLPTPPTSPPPPPLLSSELLPTVRVYPNPWRSDRHHESPIVFSGLSPKTRVQIFTMSARLVRDVMTEGPRWSWTLDNMSGKKVASGLYLYVVTDSQGQKTKGKIAILK